MKNRSSILRFQRLKQHKAMAFCACILLSACSGDDGTTVLLERQEAMPIPFPEFLINDNDVIMAVNLRPTVTLSNGDEVSINQNVGGTFSGTVDVEARSDPFLVTTIWLEDFDNQDLPLARRTDNLFVNADGSVDLISVTGYVSGDDSDNSVLDLDNDGVSNFDERKAGTNPFSDASTASIPPNDSDPTWSPQIPRFLPILDPSC